MSARLGYRAYLLRLWRETDTRWRASLEDPHTSERRAFATLEQLLEFLAQETSELAGPAASPEASQDGGHRVE
jgi:hypothetical protein